MTVEAMAVAAGAFATTNIDDLVALTAVFVADQAAGGRNTPRIWAGQIIGMGLLVAVSLAGARALAPLPVFWVSWLALLPICIGIRALLRTGKAAPAARRRPGGGTILTVAAVTAANGGDNIAVYIPLFRAIGPADAAATVLCFALLTLAWCAAAYTLGRAPGVASLTGRIGSRIAPFAYIAMGVLILTRSAFT